MLPLSPQGVAAAGTDETIIVLPAHGSTGGGAGTDSFLLHEIKKSAAENTNKKLTEINFECRIKWFCIESFTTS